jgi:hypothetical protein
MHSSKEVIVLKMEGGVGVFGLAEKQSLEGYFWFE